MNTNRVYDISTRAFVVVSVIIVLAIVGAIYFGSITTLPHEARALTLIVPVYVALWFYSGYVWAFGSKTYEPLPCRH